MQQALDLLLRSVLHIKLHIKCFSTGLNYFVIVGELPVVGIYMGAVILF